MTIDGTRLVGTELVRSRLIGTNAGPGVNGLQVDAAGSGSVIRGLEISGFDGSGIYLDGAHDTVVGGLAPDLGNIISGNGNDGVTISNDVNAVHNRILGNLIYDNAAGGIDLGDFIEPGGLQGIGCAVGGVSPGPNNYQCAPGLFFDGPSGSVTVHVYARAGTASARVELFSGQTCPIGLPGDVGVTAQAGSRRSSLRSTSL